jgi:hypothetical protein
VADAPLRRSDRRGMGQGRDGRGGGWKGEREGGSE